MTKLKIEKDTAKTIAGVFIIESLEFEDEKSNSEGELLSNILRMSGVPYDYYYIRSYDEFIYILDVFFKSNFRFLHISCHGNKEGIKLTLEEISNAELGSLLKDKLKYRRLFLSACSAVNDGLANELFPQSKVNSLIGPNRKVPMKEIAIFWGSFYYLMFKANQKAFKQKDLIINLDSLAKLYEIPIRYYKKSSKGSFYNEAKLTANSPKPDVEEFTEE